MSTIVWSRFRKSDKVRDSGETRSEHSGNKHTKELLLVEDNSPGGLSFDEGMSDRDILCTLQSHDNLSTDTAGGLGRHMGVISCTLLIAGCILGTGIFSTPSSILGSVGSVGASLMLWVLGFALSFCGLFIWLEFGTMYPRSGGEKVYLEAIYQKPKYLATVFFAANAIILSFNASGCIVFASNILISAGQVPTVWSERGIAVGVILFVTILHGFMPRTGVFIMNVFTTFKIVILLFVVVAGWVVLSGKTHVTDPYINFHDAFAGSSHSSNDYATATFKVLNAYTGWSSANYVLNNVRNPVRTLKIAGPLGLGICAVLYLLANIAYFSAASKADINETGVTVAALFFKNVFGTAAERALAIFVALSALGSTITVSFPTARVNQELAKEGIPLPFGNRFWASNWPTGKSPLPGLILNLIPTVIVIIAPPMDVAYPFVLDVQGYPQQIINFLVVVGLFWLRWKKPHLHRPFKVWWPLAAFYLVACVFCGYYISRTAEFEVYSLGSVVLVAPFLPPDNGVGDTPPLPYYLYATFTFIASEAVEKDSDGRRNCRYCLVGIGVLGFGVLYWAAWRIILPKVFGYELVPRKDVLEDGTVVTLFSREKVQ
ncbi:amino acid transporter [Paxillus ammoniavirescens]|nr:amino acid transporter [Paxillus ammoniavirescens]